MSWLYSQVLVEEYLGDISLDGEQSVQSSGNPTQQAYCAPGKMTDFSRLSRFGMMFKPLTENLGEELLMSYRAGFHAKTSPPLEKGQESMESDQECGEKWRGSFTKYDQDSCSWKTHQCSLLGDLDEFSETWPQWGLMRDGECWEQRTLEQTIRGTGFGLSPDGKATFHTPNTTGLDGGSNSRKALKKRMEKLPTPTATDYKSQPTSASWKAKGSINYKLSNPEIQAMWLTPDANCGMRGTQDIWTPKRKSGHQAQYSINQAVRDAEKIKWTTPTARDWKGTTISKNHPMGFNQCLANDVMKFPTPQASDHRDRGNMSNPSIQRRAEKGKQLNLSMVVHPTSGQLNPMWVEWLMGWPIGWTDLKPLEMDKSHCVQQPPGDF
jgi:hypothetical protein